MPDRLSLERREFLAAGAGAAVLAAGSLSAAAQGASSIAATPLKIVDFHNHYVGPNFNLTTLNGLSAGQRAYWEGVNRNLTDPRALTQAMEQGDLAARVVNTPLAFLQNADGKVPAGTVPRINDQLAELIAKNPGRLYGLATVDAFGGDDAARELIRAVKENGMRGVFVESAKSDLLLDAKEARPTLTAAAQLGVPVFVHPLTDPQLHKRFAPRGALGARLARCTINSAALCAMLDGGVFDELPNLRVVVTTLALGGVFLAGGFGDGRMIRADAPALSRRHIYIDTMGLHPAAIRAAIEMLGADHVLAGTDWPIAIEKSMPERLQKALVACGLDAAQQQMVASGNTLKLLGVA